MVDIYYIIMKCKNENFKISDEILHQYDYNFY